MFKSFCLCLYDWVYGHSSQKVSVLCVWDPMCVLSHFTHVWPSVTSWTVACQAPLSLGFSRQEHWSGLPFPSPMHACILSHFSCVQLCATLWRAAHQAPLSTGFSRQEYWSRLPFPSPPWCYYTLNINHTDIISKSINYNTPKKWHEWLIISFSLTFPNVIIDTIWKTLEVCYVLSSFSWKLNYSFLIILILIIF